MDPSDGYGAPHPVDDNIRCRYCHAKLAVFAARPWRFRCRRCKAIVQSPDAEDYRPSPREADLRPSPVSATE